MKFSGDFVFLLLKLIKLETLYIMVISMRM